MKYGMRCVWIVAAALAAGCGEEPSSEPAAAAPSVPASASGQETARLTEGMVSAVRTDERPAIVAVKFDLKSRPEAGKPLAINLAFIPNIDANTLSATFVAEGGLSIPDNQAPAMFTGVKAGSGYTYELQVMPDANGVHYISAVVQLVVGGVPRLQTYSVPVVVGPPPG